MRIMHEMMFNRLFAILILRCKLLVYLLLNEIHFVVEENI